MAKQMNRCVLVGAAGIVDYALFEKRLLPGDIFFCADGGARHLYKIGKTPDVLVGDFDSLDVPKTAGEIVTLPAEKDDTDTHFAAQLAFGRGHRDFLLLGMTGGRLDHTLSNVATAAWLTARGCRAVVADELSELTLIKDGRLTLAPVENAAVSVFAYGADARGVYERGMKYSLTGAHLTPDFPVGVSNEFTAENAEISVEKGMLLIIVTKIGKDPEPPSRLLRII